MLRKMKLDLNKKEGFTLIELMIVVAILGVLAAVAIPQYMNYIATSKRRATLENYSNAERSIKGEYSRIAAGNTPLICANIIAELNGVPFLDGLPIAGAAGTNVNPYTPKTAGVDNEAFDTVQALDGDTLIDCTTNYTDTAPAPGEYITITTWFLTEFGDSGAAADAAGIKTVNVYFE